MFSETVVFALAVLLIIYTVILFFLPIFIYNIRSLLIRQNKILEHIANSTIPQSVEIIKKAGL